MRIEKRTYQVGKDNAALVFAVQFVVDLEERLEDSDVLRGGVLEHEPLCCVSALGHINF